MEPATPRATGDIPVPFDLDAASRLNGPAWFQWDDHSLPIGLDIELRLLCPELPAAAEQATTLAAELRLAIAAHGARDGVERFLAVSQNLDELLDRRALVVLLAHLSQMTIRPRLTLRPQWPDRGPHLRRRILRPLEFAALRAAALDARRTVLVRLTAAGVSEPEIAALRIDQVEVGPNGEVWVQVAGGRGRSPRRVALAPGAAPAVEQLQTDSRDGYLIPLATPDDLASRCAAIDKILRRLLEATGLDRDPSVTVTSIRNTGLRAVHDLFGLEAAAAMAGTRNLQTLRRELGLTAQRPRRRQQGPNQPGQ